jgi:hypothetical protein
MKLTIPFREGGWMRRKNRESLACITTEPCSQSFDRKLSRLHVISEKQGFQEKTYRKEVMESRYRQIVSYEAKEDRKYNV